MVESRWNSTSSPPPSVLLSGVPKGSKFTQQAEEARAAEKKTNPKTASSSAPVQPDKPDIPAAQPASTTQSASAVLPQPATASSTAESPKIRVKFLPGTVGLFQPRMLVRSADTNLLSIRNDLAVQISQPAEDINFHFDGVIVDLQTRVGDLDVAADRKVDLTVCLDLIQIKVQVRGADGTVEVEETLLPFSRSQPITYRRVLKAVSQPGPFSVLIEDALVQELDEPVFNLSDVIVVQRSSLASH